MPLKIGRQGPERESQGASKDWLDDEAWREHWRSGAPERRMALTMPASALFLLGVGVAAVRLVPGLVMIAISAVLGLASRLIR